MAMSTRSGRVLDKEKLSKCLTEMRSTFSKAIDPLEIKIKQEPKEEGNVSSSLFAKSNRKKKPVPKVPIKIEYDNDVNEKKPKIEKYFDLFNKLENYNEDNKDSQPAETKWSPPNWPTFLRNMAVMRSQMDAPVDTMGCDQFHNDEVDPKVQRYHVLISLMLSSQTKDQITFAAMQKLKEHGLNIDNILKTSDEKLAQLIHPVGFTKTKVKYIKKTSQVLKDEYNYDIPDCIEGLCKLTGVGPKMAHICMNVAWNKVTGIGVDTHVHRISNRIGWVRKPTKTPEETRKALEEWLPFELWTDVNHLLVGFGQTICQPVKPKCSECSNITICPYSEAKAELKSKIKSEKDTEEKSPKKIEIKTELGDEPDIKKKKSKVKKESNGTFNAKQQLEEKLVKIPKKNAKK